MGCKIHGCALKSKAACEICKYWVPSQHSKYYYCLRFQETRALCDAPRSECPYCTYYETPFPGPGRPNLSGINWDNPEEVREYHKKYRQEKAK